MSHVVAGFAPAVALACLQIGVIVSTVNGSAFPFLVGAVAFMAALKVLDRRLAHLTDPASDAVPWYFMFQREYFQGVAEDTRIHWRVYAVPAWGLGGLMLAEWLFLVVHAVVDFAR